MIGALARRLGLSTSVPVSVVDEWIMPAGGNGNDADPHVLAPRGGAASVLVDDRGRLQPAGQTWTLEWTLAAGARWVSAIESERVKQRHVAPAVVETEIVTPSGPVVQRVAAAVVDGEPVALVEIENKGGVAIAVGLGVRPLVHSHQGGRGFVSYAKAEADQIDLGKQGRVRLLSSAAATVAVEGEDLLASMPEPDAGVASAAVSSRRGAAQAGVVLPLPHTATTRFYIELAGPTRVDAAVPTIDDVQRGWGVHLGSGARFVVGDTSVAEHWESAGRKLLTEWPSSARVPAWITAQSERGFGNDALRLFGELERVDDEHAVLASLGRWSMLTEPTSGLDDLYRIIGVVGRAAKSVDGSTKLAGPGWLGSGYEALADKLRLIEQPDVADWVASFTAKIDHAGSQPDPQAERGAPDSASPVNFVLAVRDSLLWDHLDTAELLPALPLAWRGRSIDAFDVPIVGGTLSFGLRWHGPRPALLWEHDVEGFTLAASALDPSWSSDETSGEVLLADPGWPKPK